MRWGNCRAARLTSSATSPATPSAAARSAAGAPPSLNRTWWQRNHPHVVGLAEDAYQNRGGDGTLDGALVSILADALEDAGRIDEAVPSHLRSGLPHRRGCWVVDLILGRE